MVRRIENLSNEDYHNATEYSDYISSSQLKRYAVSPLAFRHSLDYPEEETPAMRFGSLFHSAMETYAKGGTIEDWFGTLAVFEPPVNPKTGQAYGAGTKAFTEAYSDFLAANMDKTVCTAEDRAAVDDMVGTLVTARGGETAEYVQTLLRYAREAEVSYFYEREDGIRLKIRPDMLTAGKLVDWKTTSLVELTEESIAKAIIRYGYHISMAMYQFVLREAKGRWYTPILVFVQSREPYDCIMVDLSEWCYQYVEELDMATKGVGAMEFERLLELHAKCVCENRWPGAEDRIGGEIKVMKPAVPAWYGMKVFSEP